MKWVATILTARNPVSIIFFRFLKLQFIWAHQFKSTASLNLELGQFVIKVTNTAITTLII